MFGSDAKIMSQCEQLLCEVYDLRNTMTRFTYDMSKEEPKGSLERSKKHFLRFESWLEVEAKARTKAKEETTEVDKESEDKRKVVMDDPTEEKVVGKMTVLAKTNRCTGEQVVHLVNGSFSAPDFHPYEVLDQFETVSKCYVLGDFLAESPQLEGVQRRICDTRVSLLNFLRFDTSLMIHIFLKNVDLTKKKIQTKLFVFFPKEILNITEDNQNYHLRNSSFVDFD